MPDANSEYIVLRYQRAPRNQQNAPRVGYSSDPEKRKEQYRKHPTNGPLIEGAITKIYRPTP